MDECNFQDLRNELEATQDALQEERSRRKICERLVADLQHTIGLLSCELADKQSDYYEWAVEDCPRTLSVIHAIVFGEDE